MEKILVNDTIDLKVAIEFYGAKYEQEIKDVVNDYPCIIIGNYSEDIEFGNGYDFTAIVISDFKNKNAEVFN